MKPKATTSFEHLAQIWDAKTKNTGNVSDQDNIKAIMKFLGKPKGKVVYEIACGNGFLSRKIKKAGAKEVYASDASPTLIDIAKTEYKDADIHYSIREGADFSKLPNGKFDAIIIHQGIFYIKNIPKLMKGAYKLLKPKGVLVFTLTHPMFQVFKLRNNVSELNGNNAVMKKILNYTSNTISPVRKRWLVNGKLHNVNYFCYNRPLEYYITQCSKAGLKIDGIRETPAMTRDKNLKITRSSIPGSFVIKAIKI